MNNSMIIGSITKYLVFMLSLFSFIFSKENSLEGTIAQHWSLKTSEGKFEHLGNYTAPIDEEWTKDDDRKVIVMSFFATWCQPCIKEIDELHKLQVIYKDLPVKFFLVDLTDFFRHRQKDQKYYRDAPDTKEFLGKKGLTDITVLEDPTGRTARAYGVTVTLPSLFVIDKYRTIKMQLNELCPECLKDKMETLLNELILE